MKNKMNDGLVVKYLCEDSSILFLQTDFDGKIVNACNSFIKIVGVEKSSGNISDIFIDFENSFLLENYADNKFHLLSIETESGLPESYNFKFIKTETGFLIFGEINCSDVAILRKNLLEINSDLNNLSRELHKKNSDLAKLNIEKNKFLGMVAHDLRNPIGAIRGYAEILMYLQKDSNNLNVANILKIIIETSDNAIKLMEELLDVSRIELGILTLNKTKSDFKDLIKNTILINNIIAIKKNISIRLISTDQKLEFEFDRLKIEQVLNNLLSNAIKFSFPDSEILVRLIISTASVIVEIEDNGQGIPEREINLLFVPLAKLSVKSTAGEKSTGLGLSIAKTIVEGHSGHIGVRTIQGKGSIFYFNLPIK